MTGGLVAQQEHIVLPSISAVTTAVTTVLTMMVCIIYFLIYSLHSNKNNFIHQLHLLLAIAIGLINECSVLLSGRKLHYHME